MPTLLIVSGDLALSKFLADYFAHTAITVVHVPGWEKAIDYLEDGGAAEGILIEEQLPDGSGLTLMGYLHMKPRFAQSQVVILIEEGASYPSAVRPDVEHVLYKTVPLSTLGEYITKLLPGPTERNV